MGPRSPSPAHPPVPHSRTRSARRLRSPGAVRGRGARWAAGAAGRADGVWGLLEGWDGGVDWEQAGGIPWDMGWGSHCSGGGCCWAARTLVSFPSALGDRCDHRRPGAGPAQSASILTSPPRRLSRAAAAPARRPGVTSPATAGLNASSLGTQRCLSLCPGASPTPRPPEKRWAEAGRHAGPRKRPVTARREGLSAAGRGCRQLGQDGGRRLLPAPCLARRQGYFVPNATFVPGHRGTSRAGLSHERREWGRWVGWGSARRWIPAHQIRQLPLRCRGPRGRLGSLRCPRGAPLRGSPPFPAAPPPPPWPRVPLCTRVSGKRLWAVCGHS